MALDLAGIHRDLRAYAEWCYRIAWHNGIQPNTTSVYRDWALQTYLYNRWQNCKARGEAYTEGPCRYPANRPGDSAHNYGLAWDSVVPPEQQDAWDWIRRYVGFRVPENDPIHAELPNWRAYVVR